MVCFYWCEIADRAKKSQSIFAKDLHPSLTLREHVWMLAASGLLFCQPLKSGALFCRVVKYLDDQIVSFWRRNIRQDDYERLSKRFRLAVLACFAKRELHLVSFNQNFLHIELASIKHESAKTFFEHVAGQFSRTENLFERIIDRPVEINRLCSDFRDIAEAARIIFKFDHFSKIEKFLSILLFSLLSRL